MTPDTQSLIDAKLNGTIDAAQSQALSDWIAADKANAIEYARQSLIHTQAREVFGYPRPADLPDAAAVAPSETSNRDHKRRPRVLLALGIMAAVAACMIVILSDPSEGPSSPADVNVAEVIDEFDSLLIKDGATWTASKLPRGEFHLSDGLLHVRFGDGVQVLFQGPARFDLVSDKRLVMHNGQLSASVPPEGVGFAVETPDAEVIDFGTEFSVEVASGSSEVHVFDGLVRVQPHSDGDSDASEAVDLKTSQAVRVKAEMRRAEKIPLATDRFIRSLEEPKRRYNQLLRKLKPLAYYRMPIANRGLACVPADHAGEVIIADGQKPPLASGFLGGALRVGGSSTCLGGRVDRPAPLTTGSLTVFAFVRADSLPPGAVIMTNLTEDDGCFSLSVDDAGRLQATIRDVNSNLKSITAESALPIGEWCHVAVTVNDTELRLYEDGRLASQSPCEGLATSETATLWFGTSRSGNELWDGRIDEVVFYDRSLQGSEIEVLYQAALSHAK